MPVNGSSGSTLVKWLPRHSQHPSGTSAWWRIHPNVGVLTHQRYSAIDNVWPLFLSPETEARGTPRS
jgi:hypothetical protein